MSRPHPRRDDAPLIELADLRKTYVTGETLAVEVLRGLSLSIRAGEFVAVMGQSGSGKSTLMNILGLLDTPTGGTYRFAGRDVAALSRDDLARLRREAFGFVFQQYNLIPTVTATENVEIPATYAGMPPAERRARALALLDRLGLSHRGDHRPGQLSGGQQQRVSIARALMNGGCVILADEPTGALDSAIGAEVMALLSELAAEGHTVILITHDSAIAEAAHRIVEIRDGMLVSDTGGETGPRAGLPEAPRRDSGASLVSGMREALHAGGRALAAAPFRTALTLLGIIIGVASVIALLAIGEGAKEKVLAQLAIYGANRMYVIPGGESSRGPGGRLLPADAALVRGVPNVAAAMPYLHGNVVVRAGNVDYPTSGVAVTTDFPRILHWSLDSGVFFTKEDERSLATVAVIGTRLAARIFPDGSDPVGRMILVDDVPFQVIGVLSSKGALSGDSDDDDTIVFPFPTGSVRVFGKENLSWISVLVDDLSQADRTAAEITAVLERAHRVRDFRVFNKAATIVAQDRTQNTLTLLLGFTAAISLVVGGIGIMNVMLMTVSERTREIGIRMATGARTADILRQFLTEAMMVSGVGGLLGAGLGIVAGLGAAFVFAMPVVFSGLAILGALACAVLTGVIFGFWPALRAARLEPVAALSRE
ncbi:MacB family efflux pump subunit [Enterovirga sp.]|uniref:MacB family efflux pump subunit n=1 Tax=Enterovirga sp. TaxID=2026350 RepID=UPI002CE68C1F|nr:MacB family efflux pump subunit [Enterovirga sp.]HMO31112.1 MacB family efflux pump subunit [Enterovirga sp.]